MRVAVFGTQAFEQQFLDRANADQGHVLAYYEPNLTGKTAALAEGFPAVCVFVNDRLDADVLKKLADGGTRLAALRCAGFNNVDILAAEQHGITVARVPAYSPYAVAEHTFALILALNRKLHRAVARVREQNFSLNGLLGFDMHGKTMGVIGTGKIGAIVARIAAGFGCHLLGHDPHENPDCRALGMTYVDLPRLAAESDIITLHCPLTPQTRHLVNEEFLNMVKSGVMLINTNRGAVIDARAVIDALKRGVVGALGIDVYEEEADLFFRDLSDTIIRDDIFARLTTFPNVIITAHQAFLTHEAVANIAATTIRNITNFEQGGVAHENRVTAQHFAG